MKINSILHKIRYSYSCVFPKHLLVSPYSSSLSAITFDDGPCPRNTKILISILQEYNIKACFFFTGTEVEKYPDLVTLIYKNGHQLANHGYFHKTIKSLGDEAYIDGVIKTHRLLEKITGCSIRKFFRPPYGEMSFSVTYKLIKLGYQFSLWSYDTRDSYLDSSEKIIQHIKNEPPRKSEIFLMHEDYDRISIALPNILKYLQDQGHKFSRLDEMSLNKTHEK